MFNARRTEFPSQKKNGQKYSQTGATVAFFSNKDFAEMCVLKERSLILPLVYFCENKKGQVVAATALVSQERKDFEYRLDDRKEMGVTGSPANALMKIEAYKIGVLFGETLEEIQQCLDLVNKNDNPAAFFKELYSPLAYLG